MQFLQKGNDMNDADRKAFETALVNRCKTVVTVPQDFEAGWQACCEWRDSQVGDLVAWQTELERIRDLIAAAPIDALGTGEDSSGFCWPIRDEIVDGITKVLAALAATQMRGDA